MNARIAHIVLVLAMALAVHGSALAQNTSQVHGESEFSRRLDAILWRMRADYDLQALQTRIMIRNALTSRMYLIRGSAENIQDEYTSHADAIHMFSSTYGVGFRTDLYGFSAADVQQQRFAIGPVLRSPAKGFEFRPMVGLMSDNRNNRRDTGPNFALTGTWPNLVLGEFRFNPALMLDYARIAPRSYGTYRLWSDGAYFDENLRLSGTVQLGRSQRDSYQASSFLNRDVTDLIETIRSDTALVQAGLELPLGKGATGRIDLYTMANTRRFTNRSLADTVHSDLVDTRFLRQDYDLMMQAFIPKGDLLINPGLRLAGTSSTSGLINTALLTDDQIVRRAEILERSNYEQRSMELFTESQWNPRPATSVALRAIVGILRYDTPDINVDDRDEQTLALRLMGRHRFSPYFDAAVTLAGEAYHNVYLFAARSAENNWRRSLRLLPEFTWTPSPRLTIRHALFIRANYTVYDFQVPGRLNADQSAREYGLRTRVEYEFVPEWFVEAEGSRSELRIGRLMWDTFTEIPIDTLITYEAELALAKRVGPLKISTGARLFYKFDFLPQAVNTITVTDPEDVDRSISRIAPGALITRQLGPIVRVMLPLSAHNELYIDGWLQRQRANTRLYTAYPPEYQQDFLRQERTFVRVFYPNLTLRARFRF